MPEIDVPVAAVNPIMTPGGRVFGESLSEKSIPEQYRQEIEDFFRTRRYSKRERHLVENGMKLSIFFGGKTVVYLNMNDDWIVIAHGNPGDDTVYQAVEALPGELRAKAVLSFPEFWED